jgi:DnaJ family protein A protein 5
MRCHYEVLGVSRTANDEDIKRAYRKLALKHHPDKNGGDDAAHDEFAQIQRAYDVLSDVQQRTYYDRHRTTIVAGKNPARPVRPTKTGE